MTLFWLQIHRRFTDKYLKYRLTKEKLFKGIYAATCIAKRYQNGTCNKCNNVKQMLTSIKYYYDRNEGETLLA